MTAFTINCERVMQACASKAIFILSVHRMKFKIQNAGKQIKICIKPKNRHHLHKCRIQKSKELIKRRNCREPKSK